MGLFGNKDTEDEKPKDIPILALSIVKHPDWIAKIPGKYTILYQNTVGPIAVPVEMIQAINLMAEAGWRCVNITAGHQAHIIALMERS